MSETPRTDALANMPTPAYGNFGDFHTGKYRQLCRTLELSLHRADALLRRWFDSPRNSEELDALMGDTERELEGRE